MNCNENRRKKFSQHLNILKAKYIVKQSEIAKSINMNRQHVSGVCSGKMLFDAEHFKIACEFLRMKGAGDAELALLNRLFLEAKSGLSLNKINLDTPVVDPLKQIIAEDLDSLTPRELIEIHRKIEMYKFNHLRRANEEPAAS
jgi:transcriptional regulator with XRE-family HTH domain